MSPAAAMVLFVVVFLRNGGYTGSRQRSPLVSKKVRRLVDLIDLSTCCGNEVKKMDEKRVRNRWGFREGRIQQVMMGLDEHNEVKSGDAYLVRIPKIEGKIRKKEDGNAVYVEYICTPGMARSIQVNDAPHSPFWGANRCKTYRVGCIV